MRVICPRCEQDELSLCTYRGRPGRFIWCCECDAVFPNTSGIRPQPRLDADFFDLLQFLSIDDYRLVSGHIVTVAQDIEIPWESSNCTARICFSNSLSGVRSQWVIHDHMVAETVQVIDRVLGLIINKRIKDVEFCFYKTVDKHFRDYLNSNGLKFSVI